MSEELDLISVDAEESMNKAISHFELELTKIRAGKASPTMDIVLWRGVGIGYYDGCSMGL